MKFTYLINEFFNNYFFIQDPRVNCFVFIGTTNFNFEKVGMCPVIYILIIVALAQTVE